MKVRRLFRNAARAARSELAADLAAEQAAAVRAAVLVTYTTGELVRALRARGLEIPDHLEQDDDGNP